MNKQHNHNHMNSTHSEHNHSEHDHKEHDHPKSNDKHHHGDLKVGETCTFCAEIGKAPDQLEHPETHKEHDHSEHHAKMATDFRNRFFIALIVSIPVLILSPTIQGWLGITQFTFPGHGLLLFFLASIIALYTAWPFYTGALAELKQKQLGMMVLVSIAVGIGYLYSVATTFFIVAPDFYWEISTLTMVLLLGHWFEMRSVVSASGALKELSKLIPPVAQLVTNGKTTEVPTEQLKIDDIVLVRPGDKVPIDGIVINGAGNVNEALITGESKPVAKKVNDEVIGGSLNIDGALRVRVSKTGDETALAQIAELIRKAQTSKPRTQQLADRAAHYLTIIAIGAGATTLLVWTLFTDQPFLFALTMTVTVVVITCPHALGLAIPMVTSVTTTVASRNGILIKSMDSIEDLRDVDYVVFDKTGTLTTGEFGVTDIVAFADNSEEEVLKVSASLDQNSSHVIGKSIVKASNNKKLKIDEITNFEALPGRGIRGMLGGQKAFAGNRKILEELKNEAPSEVLDKGQELSSQGKTIIYVIVADSVIGIIALADKIRVESQEAVKKLKKQGMKVAMLTGDNQQTAKHVAEKLGLDIFFAEVLPGDKADKIKKLQQEGNKVMMVGDGINDAPALTQADVGVAIGTGTDVAAASSEIILVKNDPRDIVKIINLSKRTSAKMKQNLIWATGYNVIAIPLAAGVLASVGVILRPEWAALAMTTSSIIVVINALLLKRVNLNPES